MLEFLKNYGGTLLSVAVIGAVAVLIVIFRIRARKQGKGGCGCGCDACAMKKSCHTPKND